MKVSRMSKDITVKKDTIYKKVIEQTVYKYTPDSVFIKKQLREKQVLDSLINARKK